jgi:hypothetical protein
MLSFRHEAVGRDAGKAGEDANGRSDRENEKTHKKAKEQHSARRPCGMQILPDGVVDGGSGDQKQGTAEPGEIAVQISQRFPAALRSGILEKMAGIPNVKKPAITTAPAKNSKKRDFGCQPFATPRALK